MKEYLKKFKNYEQLRIVCVGDSTTTQDWCHPNWVDWLNYTFHESGDWNNAWKRQIINAGKDGADEQHFLANFDTTIKLNRPDLVIYSLGLNQLLPTFEINKARSEMKELLKRIKGLDVDIIAWSPYAIPNNRFKESLRSIRNLYLELSEKFDAVYIDIHNEFLKYDLKSLFTFTNNENEEWDMKENTFDFLHCNVLGNQIIAEKIAREAFDMDLLDWKFGTMDLINLDKYKLRLK